MATATGVLVEGRNGTTPRNWTRALDTDQCPRCGGLMVPDPFADLLEDKGHAGLVARRCVQCGEVIDPVILKNRGSHPAELVGEGRQPLAAPVLEERS